VYDPIYLEHNAPPGHPENKERLMRIMGLLEKQGVLERLVAVEATPVSLELLARNHSQRYIDTVRQVAERGGDHLDLDTYTSPCSYEAALMAAGGLVNAVEAVLEGKVDNAFALVRPPGHHAVKARGMGFCLFNNVAVAAHMPWRRKDWNGCLSLISTSTTAMALRRLSTMNPASSTSPPTSTPTIPARVTGGRWEGGRARVTQPMSLCQEALATRVSVSSSMNSSILWLSVTSHNSFWFRLATTLIGPTLWRRCSFR